jgi:RNA polymerase sigma-70 factor (ECF subfamily)
VTARKTEKVAQACSDLARRRPRHDATGDAEDAAQDAYVRALQLPDPGAVRDPIRYVLRTARNLFIDRRRRAGREARLFEQSDAAALDAGDMLDPERILAGKQALGGILAAIEALPPRCGEAFRLHRFENLSYAAIAQRMNISISMVEKHLAEAMARLARAKNGGEDA